MEHICVYSQSKVPHNGTHLLVGEDALPYANRCGMYVADGLGGSAGMRVDKIPTDLFDPEKMADRICDLLNVQQSFANQPEQLKSYRNYLKEHFASLCNETMCELYRDTDKHISNLKKSGYIGSHVVGAVMAYLLHCTETFNTWNLKDTAEEIRKVLPEKYKHMLNNLDIHYRETAMTRMQPYASTLSAVLYQENEEGIDAVFLNCGDSRSYILDMDGLRQAADDQGRNGVMTAMVSYKQLMENIPLDISLEENHFAKPCILMCMSDGVYGTFQGANGFDSSPMYMEGVLLSQIANADSYEALRTGLEDLFYQRGRADDCNSMAMAFFGFEDYEAVRAFARTRNQKLQEDYHLNDVPQNILVVDYAEEYRKLSVEFGEGIQDLLSLAYDDDFIQEFCEKHHTDERYGGKYVAECRRKEQEHGEAATKLNENYNQLKGLVIDNFTACIPPNVECASTSWLRGKKSNSYYDQVERDSTNYQNLIEHSLSLDEKILKETRNYSDWINRLLYDEERKEYSIPTCKETLNSIHRDILRMLSDREKTQANCKRIFRGICVLNHRAADERIQQDPQCVDRFLHTLIETNDIGMIRENPVFPGAPDRFREKLYGREQIQETVVQAAQAITEARENGKRHFWSEVGGEMIQGLLKNKECLETNPDLKETLNTRILENEKLYECSQVMEKQRELFDTYMNVHLREINSESTKYEDIKKNGWH